VTTATLDESVEEGGRKNDGLGLFTVYNARCKNTERYHLANIHHGNLKTCTQKAPSMIPVLAGLSERMHVFYSSETIPPKMSRKKISSEAFSFKYTQCLFLRCPALTSPYDGLNSIDTHVTSDGESFNLMYLFNERTYKVYTSKANM